LLGAEERGGFGAKQQIAGHRRVMSALSASLGQKEKNSGASERRP